MGVDIPLFPLAVVLFPHMPLPLHIFEERYREMIRDCQEQGISFGIVALREGLEAGPGIISPHRIGTLAQVRTLEQLDDGRYNVLVTGASRYRIRRFSTERPYLVGEVEYLEDSPGEPGHTRLLAARVTTLFRRYADTLRDLAEQPHAQLELPDDPELLSYLVAATMQVETARKQQLLEVDSAEDRLRGCLALLRREAVLLDRMLTRRDVRAGGFSLN